MPLWHCHAVRSDLSFMKTVTTRFSLKKVVDLCFGKSFWCLVKESEIHCVTCFWEKIGAWLPPSTRTRNKGVCNRCLLTDPFSLNKALIDSGGGGGLETDSHGQWSVGSHSAKVFGSWCTHLDEAIEANYRDVRSQVFIPKKGSFNGISFQSGKKFS